MRRQDLGACRMLARSCLGTPNVADPGLDITLVTLPILSLALGNA